MTENLIGETRRPGRIEIVCGSMFSGKTEELIRRMKRAKFAKQKVEIFKPAMDTRYSEEDVVSHDQNVIHSTPVESSAALHLLAMADEIGKTVEISDQEDNEIDRSVFGVADALAKGATCIVLKNTLPTGETYENVFTIHII